MADQTVPAPPAPAGILVGRLGEQPLRQSGPADARLPADQHERAPPGQRRVEVRPQGSLLALAADVSPGL